MSDEPRPVYVNERELDGLNLYLEWYVTELTPRFYWSEAALQPSQNIPFFAICRTYACVISKEGEMDT